MVVWGGMDNSLQRESMKRVEKKRGFCNSQSSERVYEERSRYPEDKKRKKASRTVVEINVSDTFT